MFQIALEFKWFFFIYLCERRLCKTKSKISWHLQKSIKESSLWKPFFIWIALIQIINPYKKVIFLIWKFSGRLVVAEGKIFLNLMLRGLYVKDICERVGEVGGISDEKNGFHLMTLQEGTLKNLYENDSVPGQTNYLD